MRINKFSNRQAVNNEKEKTIKDIGFIHSSKNQFFRDLISSKDNKFENYNKYSSNLRNIENQDKIYLQKIKETSEIYSYGKQELFKKNGQNNQLNKHNHQDKCHLNLHLFINDIHNKPNHKYESESITKINIGRLAGLFDKVEEKNTKKPINNVEKWFEIQDFKEFPRTISDISDIKDSPDLSKYEKTKTIINPKIKKYIKPDHYSVIKDPIICIKGYERIDFYNDLSNISRQFFIDKKKIQNRIILYLIKNSMI